ncbi:hypothetical protein CRE_24824 [Caenorhabditis remanei]|uniref:SCP domain-containing protein n=1 Tax=Caenorhabditis remanei TaxID=31234 RepID=E3NHP5_CAERE|nr:hypothetical protein CRE_24824 [Caenorhabditis remanei]
MLYSIVTLGILMVMIGPVASDQTAGAIIRPDGMDEEQLKFIADMNQLRLQFADKFQIQNMQMLIWSKELQNSINGSMSTSTLPNFNERNWRLMNLHDYKEFGKIQQTWITYSEDNVTTIGDSTKSNVYHHYLELFNPHQNAIGCARHNSSDSDFKVPCLIGPNGPLAEVPRYQSKKIKCTSPLIFNKVIGLCTPSGLFPDSSELMFISVLNEKRREMAKRDNISNMHELTWSEKLLQMLLIIINANNPHENYQIVEFENYASGLKLEFNKRQKLSHPSQTEISCDETRKKGNKILCLLGPNEKKTDFLRGNPGSNCIKGYENKDGLCSKSKVNPQTALETPPTAPTTKVTIEPVQQSPPTTQPPADSDDGTCPNTPPGPSPTRFTTEKVTPEPPPTHPPELADYEEIDGDEYDEDFPTGSPPSQNVYWYNDSRCGGGGLGRWIIVFVFFVFM